MFVLLFILVVITAGLFGMMGLGGGIVYVPLLSWWGLDFTTGAIPMSLLLGVATGGSAAYTYLRNRLANVRTSFTAAPTVILGAPLGAWAVQVLPVGFVKVIFSVAASYVVYRIFTARESRLTNGARVAFPAYLILIIGLFVGFFSGLLGIGGGFVLVSFLLAGGMPTKEAVATSSLVVVISTATAFAAHLPHADFPLPTALVLVVAALAGSRMGGLWVAHYARPRTLRIIVGLIILVIAVKMAVEGFTALLH